MPDITGGKPNQSVVWSTGAFLNGGFKTVDGDYANMSLTFPGGGAGRLYDLYLSAKGSNAIFGTQDTVQPSSVRILPLVKF